MHGKDDFKMNRGVRKWVDKDGEKFLRRIGVSRGQKVLDFGCGPGHYTIPAAKLVGDRGKVYAFDKDSDALRELEETAKQFGLNNISLIKGDTKIPLGNNSIDIVLCYDVVHYSGKRALVYNEVRRLLRDGGIFSLYPKHYKDDFPLMELASLGLEDIIKEVEVSGFTLKDRIHGECLHDDYYNECVVLNFEPVDKRQK